MAEIQGKIKITVMLMECINKIIPKAIIFHT